MTAMKGVRKRKETRPADITIGHRALPSPVAVAGLMSLLYAWALAGGAYEGGAFLLQLLLFALFAMVLFTLQAVQRHYRGLALAFLVLAVPPLLWDTVAFFGWDRYFGLLSLPLAAGLIAALLCYEKGKLADIYVRKGGLKEATRIGAAVLVASALLAIAIAYLYYGAGEKPLSLLLPVAGSLIVVAAACSLVEELGFRGLLLSRLVPVAGGAAAMVLQAIAFAAYGATFLYLLTSDPLYSAAAFLVAGISGVALAWMTLKSKSILAATLSNSGLHLVLMMPVFAPYFA